jgi:arylsulfatase A-like enzyme/Tfp pilus assembly protein PilF
MRIWGSLLALLAAAAAGGCGRQRPDVLIVTLDTVRADHLGTYGDSLAHTPHLDALAARGFRFDRHMTPVPITLPSHTTLFTGLTPPAHGVRDNGTFVASAELFTLAELYRDAGWATAAFVGAFPVESRFGLDQGFEVYDDDLPAEGLAGPGVYFPERPAAAVIGRALRYFESLAEDRRPRFTWIHLFDAHQPLMPPKPWDLRFAADGYRGEIAAIDEQLGRLFAAIEGEGRLDRTLVVVTSDHGEGLGEHGELTHAILLHQATLHIPLVVAGPGVPQGQTSAWTMATQVFDTLAELAGLEASADPRRGRSLVPLLERGGERPPDWPRFEAYFETVGPRASLGLSQLTAWMDGDWRLIHGPGPRLFDLGTDPRELDDRFADEPARRAELFSRLAAFLEHEEADPVSAAAREIDAETVAQLEALGYLQRGGDVGLDSLHDMLAVSGLPDPYRLAGDVSLFSEAKAAMAKDDWNRAEGLWRQILVRSPDNSNAVQSLALIAAMRGDMEQAIETLETAIARAPKESLERLLGSLLFESGRPADAMEILRDLPPSADLNAWRGRALAALGDLDGAAAQYREGLELAPDHRFLRLYLGNLLARSGELGAARAELEEVVARHPWFGLGWYNLAMVVQRLEGPEAALAFAERAASLMPSHAQSQKLLEALRQVEG